MSFFKGFVPRIGRETFPPGLYERSANALPQREKNEFPRIYECYEYYEYCVGRIFHLCTIHAGCDPQRLARRLAIGPAAMPGARGAFSAFGVVLVCGPYTTANLRLRTAATREQGPRKNTPTAREAGEAPLSVPTGIFWGWRQLPRRVEADVRPRGAFLAFGLVLVCASPTIA